MKQKIAFFETEPWEQQYFQQALADYELIFAAGSPEKTTDPSALQAEALSVFVGPQLSAEVLARFSNLRFIATRSTGFDHIDLAECRRRGIAVANVPTYGARTVAEYAMGLLLVLSRKIDQAWQRVRQSGSFSADGLRGFDLRGKTLGVIGTGHIGLEFIRIARGFEMNIIAADINPDVQHARELGFRYVTLDELLAASDVISLHVPHSPATHHLLNRENMRRIKPGAVLINTARGGVVETAGLIEALHEGRLAGAGLDVLEEEGAIREERELLLYGHPEERQLRIILQNHALIRMPNVLVTPHSAFNTQEALEEIVRVTAENLRGFFAGQPQNAVA